jgi:hypothetical protein
MPKLSKKLKHFSKFFEYKFGFGDEKEELIKGKYSGK